MRKKLQETMYDQIREFVYTQLEGYIDIVFDREKMEKQIDFYYEKNNCEFTVYVDDKDLMDENGFYDDICQLIHFHPEDLLYVYVHLDEEMKRISANLNKYLEYKKNKGE
jgi:hypothetical protein